MWPLPPTGRTSIWSAPGACRRPARRTRPLSPAWKHSALPNGWSSRSGVSGPGRRLSCSRSRCRTLLFGVGWYLSDLEVGPDGRVTKTFVTRLNEETFALAVGQAQAPKPHGNPDGGRNPAFKPVHTFHLGIWFELGARPEQPMAAPILRRRSTATTRPASRCSTPARSASRRAAAADRLTPQRERRS